MWTGLEKNYFSVFQSLIFLSNPNVELLNSSLVLPSTIINDNFSAEDGAMAKLWTTELQFKVLDQCLQLHGGYGYMQEYPIARAFTDSRVQRIYGGTNEVMKEIISRSL